MFGHKKLKSSFSSHEFACHRNNLEQICFYLIEAGESYTPTSTHGSGLMHEGPAGKEVLKIYDSKQRSSGDLSMVSQAVLYLCLY